MIGEQVLRPSKVIVNKIEDEKAAEDMPDAAKKNTETEQES